MKEDEINNYFISKVDCDYAISKADSVIDYIERLKCNINNNIDIAIDDSVQLSFLKENAIDRINKLFIFAISQTNSSKIIEKYNLNEPEEAAK